MCASFTQSFSAIILMLFKAGVFIYLFMATSIYTANSKRVVLQVT